MTFASLRKQLKIAPGLRVSIEDQRRTELSGDVVQATLRAKNRFDTQWERLTRAEQDEIVDRLHDDADEAKLFGWLQAKFGLDEQRAQAVVDAPLPVGYGRMGKTASERILEKLSEGVVTYAEAARAAGYHHSDFRPEQRRDSLPYYGEVLSRHVIPPAAHPTGDGDADTHGRIANPTVHIALNQLRKIVNVLLALYGPPQEIAIEVARDLKNSLEQRRAIENEQKKNTEANDRHRKDLVEHGVAVNGRNLLKMHLWDRLKPDSRVCPFTGERIAFTRLFADDSPFEIEHLLPFSRTLDDSRANQVLATRQANRDKKNKSPFEAFGTSPAPYSWEAILRRVEDFPPGVRCALLPTQ